MNRAKPGRQQTREIDGLVQGRMGEIVGYGQQATTSVMKWVPRGAVDWR